MTGLARVPTLTDERGTGSILTAASYFSLPTERFSGLSFRHVHTFKSSFKDALLLFIAWKFLFFWKYVPGKGKKRVEVSSTRVARVRTVTARVRNLLTAHLLGSCSLPTERFSGYLPGMLTLSKVAAKMRYYFLLHESFYFFENTCLERVKNASKCPAPVSPEYVRLRHGFETLLTAHPRGFLFTSNDRAFTEFVSQLLRKNLCVVEVKPNKTNMCT